MGLLREARNDSVAEEDETHVIHTPYGTQRFERRTGEALHPEREPLELLNRIRETRLLGHPLKGELRLLRNSRINQRDQQHLWQLWAAGKKYISREKIGNLAPRLGLTN